MKNIAYLISATLFTSVSLLNAVVDMDTNTLLALSSSGMSWLVAGLFIND